MIDNVPVGSSKITDMQFIFFGITLVRVTSHKHSQHFRGFCRTLL